MPINILHPCDAFATSAGYESWTTALAAMKSGTVVTGVGPRSGARTMISIDAFNQRTEAEGLYTIRTEEGFVMVGFRENFPKDVVAAHENEMEAIARRWKLGDSSVATPTVPDDDRSA
jgi:hypothetical protein